MQRFGFSGSGSHLIPLGFISFWVSDFRFTRTTDFIIFCIFVLGFDSFTDTMGQAPFGTMPLFRFRGVCGWPPGAITATPNPFVANPRWNLGGALVGVILGPVAVRATGACFALINLAFNPSGLLSGTPSAFAKFTGGEDRTLSNFFKDPFPNIANPKVFFGSPCSVSA